MVPTREHISHNFELMQYSFNQSVDLRSSQAPHVSQQIRRDKLRIQQDISSTPSSSSPSDRNSNPILQSQESEESRNSGLSRTGYSGLPGIGGLLALRYDPNSMISAEMMRFPAAGELSSFMDTVPLSDSGWKSLNHQANTDCTMNCMQNPVTQTPVMGSMVLGSVGGFPIYSPCEQFSLTVVNPNGECGEDVHPNLVHQSQLLSHVSKDMKIKEQSLDLLPSFGNLQSDQCGFNEWNHKLGWLRPQWVDGSFIGRNADDGGFGTDSTGQSLSLSLSFRNPRELRLQHETRLGIENLAGCSASACSIDHHEKHKDESNGECCSYQKDGANMLSGASISRIPKNPVPLGPFTGYATVLKNSKFLRPAQQLLDELRNKGKVAIGGSTAIGGGSDIGKLHTNNGQVETDRKYGDSSASCDIPSNRMVNPPCISSSVYLSTNTPAELGGEKPVSASADHNEHRRNKNRLITMLDEVYRKYWHHYGQLQVVLTSFESVAGLNNVAPYTSMALKAMSRHFQHLKHAVNDRLKSTRKVLGEDCFLPATAREEDISRPRLEALQHRKAGVWSIGEPHLQQVWRPQRGLPEQAVAVLRAWLFEHFLHPYPTDSDKQMLAKQTGLTRSQVSNWFINARVRLWKPLVEEIHMLEARDSSSVDLNSVKKLESVTAIGERLARSHQVQPVLEKYPNCNGSNNRYSSVLPTNRLQPGVSPMPICEEHSVGTSGKLYQSVEALAKATQAKDGVGGVCLTLGLHHNRICFPSSHEETMQRFSVEDKQDDSNT